MILIRVIGGPWPERIGCTGHVVEDPGNHIYPFDKRPQSERIVKLDNDPLGDSTRNWTCAMNVRDIEFIGEDATKPRRHDEEDPHDF